MNRREQGAISVASSAIAASTGVVWQGTAAADSYTGTSFNDYLRGLAGNDHLVGGGGQDALEGNAGVDTLEGGFGDDILYVDDPNDVVIEYAGQGGFDRVRLHVNLSYALAPDAEVEDLQPIVSGLEAINLTGSNTANLIGGTEGANTILGLGGNDRVYAYGGDDHLDGGAGDDRLDGEYGNDRLIGGEGADYLAGGNGFDRLEGGVGDDEMVGGRGNDNLLGQAGRDLLKGGDHNDRLSGGLGRDVLNGGLGRDAFVFDVRPVAANADLLQDFRSIDDVILLEKAVLRKLGPAGRLKADAFHLGKAAADAEDRVVYDRATGALYYDTDGIGGAAQVKIATLSNRAQLHLSDLVVI